MKEWRSLPSELLLDGVYGSSYLSYFAMYNVHFLAQIIEGEIRMHILHGNNDSIPCI